MIRQYEMRAPGDPQPAGDIYSPPLEHLYFLRERPRIDDHAVTQQAANGRVQGTGRDQVENELLVTDLHRMTGVRPPLVPGDDGRLLGDHIGDLPLALIAPLGAYQHDAACGLAEHSVPRGRRIQAQASMCECLPDPGTGALVRWK